MVCAFKLRSAAAEVPLQWLFFSLQHFEAKPHDLSPIFAHFTTHTTNCNIANQFLHDNLYYQSSRVHFRYWKLLWLPKLVVYPNITSNVTINHHISIRFHFANTSQKSFHLRLALNFLKIGQGKFKCKFIPFFIVKTILDCYIR